MRPHILLAALLSTCLATGMADAETYKWKDAQGRTIISDTPPPGNVRARTVIGSSQTEPKATDKESTEDGTKEGAKEGAKDSVPKTAAEKDIELRKRQQEKEEKATKEKKEADAKAERAENCDRARRQLAMLESGQRVSTTDDKGERRFIDDAERQREIERSRRYLAETCK